MVSKTNDNDPYRQSANHLEFQSMKVLFFSFFLFILFFAGRFCFTKCFESSRVRAYVRLKLKLFENFTENTDTKAPKTTNFQKQKENSFVSHTQSMWRDWSQFSLPLFFSRFIVSRTLCVPGAWYCLLLMMMPGTLKSVIQMGMIQLKSVTSYL